MAGMFDPSQGFQQAPDESPLVEMDSLQRRRKLIDAMQARNMQLPIQGRHGLAQALMQIGSTFLLNRAQEGATQEAQQIERGRQESLRKGLDTYLDTSQGKPGQTMSTAQAENLMQNGVQPQLEEPQKANPRAAVVQAMASRHPELQAIGKLGMQELIQQGKKSGFKDHVTQDGSIVRVWDDGRPPTNLGNYAKPKDQWTDPYLMNNPEGKPMLVKRNLATNEVDVVDKAPKVSANANANANAVQKGETKFAEQLGKDVATEFKQARDNAQAGYKAKSFVGQMQALEQQGIFSGPTANIATTLAAVADVAGLPVDKTKLANSQAYQQQFASQVAAVLTAGGGIGRSMTDADRKAFEQSLPTMLMNPGGRAQVYAMINNQADQDIARAKSFQQQLIQNPTYRDAAGMLTVNPVDNAPIGRAGGVINPGAQPLPGVQGSGPRVTNW